MDGGGSLRHRRVMTSGLLRTLGLLGLAAAAGLLLVWLVAAAPPLLPRADGPRVGGAPGALSRPRAVHGRRRAPRLARAASGGRARPARRPARERGLGARSRLLRRRLRLRGAIAAARRLPRRVPRLRPAAGVAVGGGARRDRAPRHRRRAPRRRGTGARRRRVDRERRRRARRRGRARRGGRAPPRDAAGERAVGGAPPLPVPARLRPPRRVPRRPRAAALRRPGRVPRRGRRRGGVRRPRAGRCSTPTRAGSGSGSTRGAGHNTLDWRPGIARWREMVELVAGGR